MEEKIDNRSILDEAIEAKAQYAIDNPGDSDQELRSAVEAYVKVKEADRIEREEMEKRKENSWKSKVLKWLGTLTTAAAPAVIVELLREHFMKREADRAYEVEANGGIVPSSTIGRKVFNGIFKF